MLTYLIWDHECDRQTHGINVVIPHFALKCIVW